MKSLYLQLVRLRFDTKDIHLRNFWDAASARQWPSHAVVRVGSWAADDVEELHALMAVSQDCVVARDAASLSIAMKALLRFGSRILFVDPFFDPYNKRYKKTLRDCLAVTSASNPNAECEIHYRYHESKPNQDDLEREAATLFRGYDS